MNLIGFTDIETTGLSQADGHRIIEFGLLIYDADTRELKGKLIQRINPERSIQAEAQRVHGISYEELVDEPKWDEVASKIAKVIGLCKCVVAHNGMSFDLPFIRNELMRVGIAMPDVTLIDTMLDARWATPNGKLPSLKELCFALDVEYDPEKAHSAEYDIMVMADSFFKGLDQGFFKLPEVMVTA